jgi:hypothetical protein
MQFKGLLMTQAGRHPLQNSPAALLAFIISRHSKAAFRLVAGFCIFTGAANGQTRFSTLPGPAFK